MMGNLNNSSRQGVKYWSRYYESSWDKESERWESILKQKLRFIYIARNGLRATPKKLRLSSFNSG